MIGLSRSPVLAIPCVWFIFAVVKAACLPLPIAQESEWDVQTRRFATINYSDKPLSTQTARRRNYSTGLAAIQNAGLVPHCRNRGKNISCRIGDIISGMASGAQEWRSVDHHLCQFVRPCVALQFTVFENRRSVITRS